MSSAAIVLASLIAAGGCGPVEYLHQVTRRAQTAVSAAKSAGADRHAPYEYTAAAEYLHKAREEAGYADYQSAIRFGRKAEVLALRAAKIALATAGRQPLEAGESPIDPSESPATPTSDDGPSADGEGRDE